MLSLSLWFRQGLGERRSGRLPEPFMFSTIHQGFEWLIPAFIDVSLGTQPGVASRETNGA